MTGYGFVTKAYSASQNSWANHCGMKQSHFVMDKQLRADCKTERIAPNKKSRSAVTALFNMPFHTKSLVGNKDLLELPLGDAHQLQNQLLDG
jgi:hypothetical protein